MRHRLISLPLGLAIFIALAPVALAADGEGLLGRTNDKIVTFFGFGVIAFFISFVIVASLIQGRLEKRKDRRSAELERLANR